MSRTHTRQPNPQGGWSLVEMMFVVLIIAAVGAIAVMVMPIAIQFAKADSGVQQVESALRVAREQAIGQRRNVQVAFVAPNRITVTRVETDGTLTPISSTDLENRLQLILFAGLPDTPDAFGNATPASFGGAASVAFTSEGTFVDQNGDQVNGSVFIGVPNEPTSARAVTIFGPTALIRAWTWQGTNWVD